jgi:hypothetical protein
VTAQKEDFGGTASGGKLNLTAAAVKLAYFFALLKNKLALTMFCLCWRIISYAPEISPLATSPATAGFMTPLCGRWSRPDKVRFFKWLTPQFSYI